MDRSEAEAKADPIPAAEEGVEAPASDSEREARSNRRFLILLFAVWCFHAANNAYYLLTTDSPPNYDCGYHLQLSIHVHARFLDLESENYLKGVYFSTGFYPFFGYMAAVPFYLMFGLNQSAAVAGNLLYLALLLFSTHAIGKRLHSPMAGFVSACLLAFFPFVFGVSRNYYIENGLLAVTALSVLCLLRTEGFSNRKWSLLFGLAIGLGMMTKWTFAIQLFLPVVWVLGQILFDLRKSLHDRRLVTNPLGWIFLAVGFGLLACAAAVERRPLWAFAACIPLLFAGALLSPVQSIRDRLLNLGLAGLASAAFCYPWYLRHWDLVTGVADHFFDPVKTGQAAPWTLGAFLYYPFAMESNLLGPALFLVFLLSAVLFPWRSLARYGVVLAWIVGSYLVISNIPIRDPRYISPFLPGVALFMGIALSSVPWRGVRRTLFGVAAVGAIWQFGMMTFEWPLPSGNHWRMGPYGNLYSFWNHGVYGTGRDRNEKWSHREITADFKAHAFLDSEEAGKPQLRCLIDYPAVHQGVFQFLAMAEGGSWEAVFERNIGRLDQELNRWVQTEAVLFPRVPLEGDYYRLSGERHPFEFDDHPNSFLGIRFPHRTEYTIPSGETLVLAHRNRSGFLSPEGEGGMPIGDRVKLLTADSQPIQKGEEWWIEAVVRVRYLNIDNWPSGELDRVWVELFTPEGDLIEAKSFPFPHGFETGQEEDLIFDWRLSPTLEGRVCQVAVRLVSEDEVGAPEGHYPSVFLERVVFVGPLNP